MSQVNRSFRTLAVGCALLALVVAGCSKKNGTPFDADSGHPADFFAKHGTYYQADSGSCQECHGGDLLGGISAVSCSTSSFGNQSCHAGGPGAAAGHGAGWSAASSHGATAKKAPGAASGFAYCKGCHGTDFKGGSSGQSCFPCHGWNAPHAKSGWSGGGSKHQSTNTGNASVCAQCHQKAAGTPGCYNSTLCHGAKNSGHPSGWSAGNQHGATAKAAPGGSSGFSYCESCHGSGLSGGSANQSCLVNSGCHGWSAPHANSGWAGGGSSHRTTDMGNASVCAQCHQKAAGTPGCFNSTLCHGSSGGHPAGWSAGSQHGATAEAAPGAASGMAYCSGCHGNTFGGGTGPSCLTCHGGNAPHPYNNWRGESGRHRNVNTGNTTVCARCHSQLVGSSNCASTNGCHTD